MFGVCCGMGVMLVGALIVTEAPTVGVWVCVVGVAIIACDLSNAACKLPSDVVDKDDAPPQNGAPHRAGGP